LTRCGSSKKREALQLLSAYTQRLPAFECMLCALSSSAPAEQAIASDEHGTVLLNRFAQRRGHLMVLPRSHIEHAHELDWSVYAALQRLAYDASIALQRVLAPLRIWNAVLGSAMPLATSYAHVHIHVLPIYESDDRSRPARVFSWSEGVTIYDDAEAQQLVQQLREAWPTSRASRC
jgi:diadenosine tetraphosphate (Ap4A) HIT family hydrolase